MKLLLVDGHYYVYRSYFAIRNLSNSKGEATNAIYGFLQTLRRMVRDVAPDLAAVVWDKGIPTRRTEMQPEYKAQRPEMPDDMKTQLRCIQNEVVPLMGFHGVGLENTEADDLMASYTCTARGLGHEVVLATNDKDLFQLVDEKVKVYTTNKTDLATPKDTHALLGADAVLKKWGVSPDQIGDVLALIGDSVDNIPGVSGLGNKTAAALIQEYGSTSKLLERLDSVKKEGLRLKLLAARTQIAQNREMVRLDTDLPLPVPLERLLIQPRYVELIPILERCEFKTLLAEIRAEAAKAGRAQEMAPLASQPAANIVPLPMTIAAQPVQGNLF